MLTDIGINTTDSGTAVAVQKDGKIVVAGFRSSDDTAPGGFALVRYMSDGARDASFGTGGKVVTLGFNDAEVGSGTAMALQTDGKVVVAGSAFVFGREANTAFALARYTTSGALDASFGRGGKVQTDLTGEDDAANAVAVQADGKIIAVGSTAGSKGMSAVLVRYTATGKLDTSFGRGGKVFTNFNLVPWDIPSPLALQKNGRIVVAGASGSNVALGRGSNVTLARYTK